MGDDAYTPTLAGTMESVRVRSGLTCVHVFPLLLVFHTTFSAKNNVCGSTVENTSGAVRTERKPAVGPACGPTC